MFVKNLIFLVGVSLVLTQAELLNKYPSQTRVELELDPSGKDSLCKCAGTKCELDTATAEKICKTFKQRFHYYGHQSFHFTFCEFDPISCTSLKGSSPKSYLMRIIFDDYYLRTSHFNSGPDAARIAIVNLLSKKRFHPSVWFDKKPLSAKTFRGITAIPIEFWGTLNEDVSKFADYEMCTTGSCAKTMNTLCNQFINAWKKVDSDMMKNNIGCHVRRFYKHKNEIRVSWSIMINHRQMILSKTVTSLDALKARIDRLLKKMERPAMLKCFSVSGVMPLDFCEISASSLTTQKYHPDMSDPLSTPFRLSSHLYYTKLLEQLYAAEDKYPSCIRKIAKRSLSNKGGMVDLAMDLWVSFTCYKKRGIKTCEDVTKAISQQWEKGNKLYYSPWTPKYEFKLLHTGLSL